MTAPTGAGIESVTSSSSTSTLPAISTNAVTGDLASGLLLGVFVAMGSTTALPNATLSRNGTIDTGWNADVNAVANSGAGTLKLQIFSKVLGPADVDGSGNLYSIGPTGFVNSGTTRLYFVARYHADGWSSTAATRRTDAIVVAAGSVANNATMFSPTDPARAAFALAAFSGGLATSKHLTFTGTGAGSIASHYPHAGSAFSGVDTGQGACQLDWIDLDAADAISAISVEQGSANTSHANAFVQYQTRPPVVALGTATSTSTGVALTRRERLALGTATSTSSALALAVGGAPITLGVATTTSTGIALTRRERLALTTASSTSSGRPLTASDSVALAPATTATVAGPVAWYHSATVVWGLSTPSGAFTSSVLRVWAYCAGTTDVAEIRLALYQGTTLVTEGPWAALAGTTPTAYELPIVGTITSYSTLRAEVTVRASSSAVPKISAVELELVSQLTPATATIVAQLLTTYERLALPTATSTSTAQPLRLAALVALGTATTTITARAMRALISRDLTISAGQPAVAWAAAQPAIAWAAGHPSIA